MNRRGFLTFVGAFAAGAALPKALLSEKVARLTAGWVKPEMIDLYRVSAPLEAGFYTFTGAAWKGTEFIGCYVGGVKAEGGETLIEQPSAGTRILEPRLIKGGLTFPNTSWDGSFSMTAEEMLAHENRMRGIPARKA